MIAVGNVGGLNAIALSPDGTKAVTGTDEGEALLWDMRSGQVLYRFIPPSGDPQGSDALINAVAYAPNGLFVAAGTQAGNLYIWRVPKKFLLSFP